MPKATPIPYDDEAGIAAMVASGEHRAVVGGLREEVGQVQFEFLLSCGLPANSIGQILTWQNNWVGGNAADGGRAGTLTAPIAAVFLP